MNTISNGHVKNSVTDLGWIQLRSVTFGYVTSIPIFQDFTWQVKKGESWAIIGPSGSGKTTLLYLLSGLRFPTSGTVLIKDEPIIRPRPHTGLIIQDYGLMPWATVSQNASLGVQIRDFYGPDGLHSPVDFKPDFDVDHWLERLRMSKHRDKYPHQISGGQRQRTAIARTLALNPDLLLMDEPFSSLDAPTRESLQDLTYDIWLEENLTLITVTHTIEEAVVLGRKILILNDPPNINPHIVENPGAGTKDFRDSNDYQLLCKQLRRELGEK